MRYDIKADVINQALLGELFYVYNGLGGRGKTSLYI